MDKGGNININTYEQGTTALQDLLIGRIDAQFLDDDTARKFVADNKGKVKIAGEISPKPPQVYAIGVQEGQHRVAEETQRRRSGDLQVRRMGEDRAPVHAEREGRRQVPGQMPAGIDSYKQPIPGLPQ